MINARSVTSAMLIALFMGVVSVAATSCSGDQGCSERTCADGCCGADGVCRASAPSSCGLGGASCDDCTSRRLGCIDGTCQPYDQGCLDLNRTCSLDAQCCTGICSKGICSDTQCKSGGNSCSTGLQCCSGICEQSLCTSAGCGFAGVACSASEPCCSPLLCDASGVCVPPCKGGGAECMQNSECCNNQCVGGRCQSSSTTCKQKFETCQFESDCCSGLYCTDGACK